MKYINAISIAVLPAIWVLIFMLFYTSGSSILGDLPRAALILFGFALPFAASLLVNKILIRGGIKEKVFYVLKAQGIMVVFALLYSLVGGLQSEPEDFMVGFFLLYVVWTGIVTLACLLFYLFLYVFKASRDIYDENENTK